MNAERLLQLYDRVAEAPDAVSRLRRFVLDLAVRGKLVEQNPEDEPASELLERISMEKARLVKAQQIKKPKPLPSIDEPPFDVPPTWEWTRLGEAAELVRGVSFSASAKSSMPGEGLLPCLRSGNIQAETIWDNLIYVPRSSLKSDSRLVKSGDILISIANSYALVGKCSIVDEVPFEATFGAFLAAIRLYIVLPAYAKAFLASEYSAKAFRVGSSQTTNIANITFSTIRNHYFPLPPLAEQHRIVAKVDELMTLCDRLEETHNTRETTRDRLTTATLSHLTAPDTDKQSFRTHARFALDAVPALTTRPDQIKTLRQTIFNLAVRGKLVEQDPADEPASELLKRIVEQRSALVKAGDLGQTRSLSPLTDDDTTFPVPTGWTWCRLGDLVLDSDSGWSPRTENHPREGDEWGVLKVSAVSWGRFDPTENKQLLRGAEPRLQAQVHEGDFLLSRANTAELVARAVLVPQEPQKLMMSDKIVRLRLGSDCVPHFVWLVNNYADFARTYYATKATGVSPSMKNVSRAVILELPVALPPLPEQNRIVAKVDELMSLCDRLEAGLNQADTKRSRLLESLLAETLASTQEEREAA